MPILEIIQSSVSLSSSWTVRSVENYDTGEWTHEYSTPTTASDSRTFDLSALPSGAQIIGAQLSCTRWGTGAVRAMDGADADRVEIAPGRITPGGSLNVSFVFKASGGTGHSAVGSTRTYTETAGWNTPALAVEYTLPYTAPSAPTALFLSKAQAAPGEALTLSWTGARPGNQVQVSGYAIYRAASPGGAYALLETVSAQANSAEVTAPSGPGSYFYKIKTLGGVTGYDSALSEASAGVSVEVTAPQAPESLTMTPGSTYPGGAATLAFSGAAAGANNPITGYAVYRAEQENGPYAVIGETAEPSYSVTAPSGGAYYYRVAALGESMNGALSESSASLTADLSGTSDFTMNKSVVDAGTALVLTSTTNASKAHTLTAQIGDSARTVFFAAGAALSFTPPLAWLSEMPDSETGEMTLRLQTAGGGTIVKTVVLRCPDTVVPTVTGATATRVDGDVPSAWGSYIAGKSKATIALSTAATAAYDSPIQSYRISGCGGSAAGESLPLSMTTALLQAGEQSITVEATDARGRTGKQTLTLSVESYEAPTLRNILTLRSDANGTESDEGTYAAASAAPVFSSCAGQNAAVVSVAYREQGTSAWTQAGALTNGALVFGGDLNTGKNYEIRYTITDSLQGEAVFYDVVTRALVELHIKRGGGAWAFGGVANEDGALKVYGDLRVEGAIQSSNLFAYNEANALLTILPRTGTFSFDASTGTLSITD